MRSADAVTIARIALVFVIGYMIIAKYNAVAVVLLMLIMFAMDNLDGYLATSKRPSIFDFVSYIGRELHGGRSKVKAANASRYGAYLDIAGDRITEYTFWIIFTYLGVLPLFVVLVIVTRNSISDAFTASTGKTFSKMKTAFGSIASSHISRGLYGALKAINFIYLSLVVLSNWPISVGYALTAVVVAYSLLRGAAEVHEALI